MQYMLAQGSNVMWLDGVILLPFIVMGIHSAVCSRRFDLTELAAPAADEQRAARFFRHRAELLRLRAGRQTIARRRAQGGEAETDDGPHVVHGRHEAAQHAADDQTVGRNEQKLGAKVEEGEHGGAQRLPQMARPRASEGGRDAKALPRVQYVRGADDQVDRDGHGYQPDGGPAQEEHRQVRAGGDDGDGQTDGLQESVPPAGADQRLPRAEGQEHRGVHRHQKADLLQHLPLLLTKGGDGAGHPEGDEQARGEDEQAGRGAGLHVKAEIAALTLRIGAFVARRQTAGESGTQAEGEQHQKFGDGVRHAVQAVILLPEKAEHEGEIQQRHKNADQPPDRGDPGGRCESFILHRTQDLLSSDDGKRAGSAKAPLNAL